MYTCMQLCWSVRMDAKILHGGATCELVQEVSVPGEQEARGLTEQRGWNALSLPTMRSSVRLLARELLLMQGEPVLLRLPKPETGVRRWVQNLE